MATLPPADRRKLVGVLGMLGSDAVGERAAAALLATRLMKAAGLQWDQVIDAGAPQGLRQVRPGQGHTPPGKGADLELCLKHLGAVTPWECQFVQSLQHRRKRSVRQVEILAGIAASLRKRGLV